jgi:hypothetical protein
MPIFAAMPLRAQEPTFMDAATHPGAGQFYARLLLSRSEYEQAATEVKLNTAILKLSYGIQPTLALLLDGEFADLSTGGRDETGLRQTTLQLKYRLFKLDTGPLNTWRMSMLAGLALPGNMETLSPDNAYPRGSLVSTAILGRHGLNAEFKWDGYRNEAERLSVNGSHLYRLSPSEYRLDTRGAWYSMVESLNEFTTDGDSRHDVALGMLYEARRWAWEASLRLPIARNGPRDDTYNLTMGVRFLP